MLSEPDPDQRLDEQFRALPRHERIALFMRDEQARPITWGAHHIGTPEAPLDGWFPHLEDAWSRGLGCGIMSPWGHGKTTFLNGVILDEIGLDQNIRVHLISKRLEIAGERVGSCKAYIEGSDEYHAVHRQVRPDRSLWATERIRVIRQSRSPDPTLSAYGILAGGVGKRSDLSAYDDPVDIESLSGAIRKSTADAFWNTWEPRVDQPHGRRLYIGTAYHVEDLAHVLVRTPGWAWLVQGISDDEQSIESIRIVND